LNDEMKHKWGKSFRARNPLYNWPWILSSKKKQKFYRALICLKMLDSDFVPEVGIFEIQNSLAVDLRVAYFRDWFDECFLYENKMWWKWLDQLCNVIIFVTELCNLFLLNYIHLNLMKIIWKECFSFIENCTWKIQIEKVTLILFLPKCI